jgi:hypothetical protein
MRVSEHVYRQATPARPDLAISRLERPFERSDIILTANAQALGQGNCSVDAPRPACLP